MHDNRPHAWDAPHLWPDDYDGHVYLGRVMERLGSIMHGLAWLRHVRALDDKAIEIGAQFGQSREDVSAQIETERQMMWIQRWRVQVAIRVLGRAGNLVTAYQSGDGDLRQLPTHVWNVRYNAPRFTYFRINPDEAISVEPDGPGFRDIFFTGDSVAQVEREFFQQYAGPIYEAEAATAAREAESDLPQSKQARADRDAAEAEMIGKAIDEACRQLTPDDAMTKNRLLTILRRTGYPLSNYRFEQTVWPRARERMGWDSKGRGGKKPVLPQSLPNRQHYRP